MLQLRTASISWKAVTVCKRNIFYRKKYEWNKGAIFSFLYDDHQIFSRQGLNRFLKKKDEQELRNLQKFKPEMFEIHGPDQWVAKFVLSFRGKIKPKDDVVWLTRESKLNSEIVVEGIDVSSMVLFPAGLDNIRYLKHLRYIKYGSYITDWYLFHLQAFSQSLEFVDVSGCIDITDAGIASLICLKNLKCLDITGCTKIKNPEILAIHLETHNPELVILGLDSLSKVDEDQLQEELNSSRFLNLGEVLESRSQGKLSGQNITEDISDISENSYSSYKVHKEVTS